jgi:cell division topological specificity factor MinE
LVLIIYFFVTIRRASTSKFKLHITQFDIMKLQSPRLGSVTVSPTLGSDKQIIAKLASSKLEDHQPLLPSQPLFSLSLSLTHFLFSSLRPQQPQKFHFAANPTSYRRTTFKSTTVTARRSPSTSPSPPSPRDLTITDASSDADVVNFARRRLQQRSRTSSQQADDDSPITDFVRKVKAAWNIFFPERPKSLSPKEEGKKRLRMILVADRCGVTPDSLAGMRESIVKAMEQYVEVEDEDSVEVNLSMDPDIGTIYSVAVPVRRVKATRVSTRDLEGEGDSGAFGMEDETDSSARFPYGV